MTMALSSSTFSICPPKDDVVGVKGKSSTAQIYETYEGFLESSAKKCGRANGTSMVANESYSLEEDFARENDSKGSSSSVGQSLRKNIKSWCEATGEQVNITVHFKGSSFQLHEVPLISRSGYLKRMLMDAKEIRIPDDCPGSPENFEVMANFCYSSAVQMESSNGAELRCLSEYMQMSEEYGTANLIDRSDAYLTQVALRSWQDTMVVLLQCQNLCPSAEDLGIVHQCVQSLAVLACMEMVDQPERTSQHGTSIESQFWSDLSVSARDCSSPDWWMEDLLRLPCGLFERVIAAIRREGMQEKYVSQAIVRFVDRWVFTSSYPESEDAISEERFNQYTSDPQWKSSHHNLVEAVVRLLPDEKDAVPISFLFSLLRCALACDSSSDCKNQLELRIASQLELATISDFLYPFKIAEDGCISAAEVSCMRRIVNSFMSQQRSLSDASEALPTFSSNEVPENFYCAYAVSAVAKVWDEYLVEVARDLTLSPSKFLELAEVVPSYARATHDHLYRAIHIYLKVHPRFSQEERQLVCGILNCQKLSPEMCTHAVLNELMPLRMIVQAMFMQQLQTRNVLNGHLQYNGQSMSLESFPPFSANGASFGRNSLGNRTRTESFRSTRESSRSRHDSFDSVGRESLGGDDETEDDESTLGFIFKREAAFRQAALLKADYQATETRLQNLEDELASMRKRMARSHGPVSKCSTDKKRKESLKEVAEVLSTSDIEGDDEAGEVKFDARGGNGILTRALRLVTLGAYRRRKAGGDSSMLELAQSEHILCGRREGRRNNHQIVKSSKQVQSKSGRNIRFQDSICTSSNSVKIRHSRRHSRS